MDEHFIESTSDSGLSRHTIQIKYNALFKERHYKGMTEINAFDSRSAQDLFFCRILIYLLRHSHDFVFFVELGLVQTCYNLCL